LSVTLALIYGLFKQACDLEFAQEQASKRIEAEQAEKQKISDVNAAAEVWAYARWTDA
jgi:hypothetical protein